MSIRQFAMVVLLAMLTTQIGAQEDFDREELEVRLEQARRQLDDAARQMGTLHGKLYRMETLGEQGNKPVLGILLGNRMPSGGIEIIAVTPGSGAQVAGITAGDVLLSVNGTDIAAADSAMEALHEGLSDILPGDSVLVEYQRDGSLFSAEVTTHSRGHYIMGMVGAPGFDVKIGGLAHRRALEAGNWTQSHWDQEALENLEGLKVLEGLHALGPVLAARGVAMSRGLRLEYVKAELARYFGVDEGVLVMSTANENSQLRGGDILLSVNGEPVDSAHDAYRALHESAANPVPVEVLRQGSQQALSLAPEDLGSGYSVIRIQGGSATIPGADPEHIHRPH